MFFRYPGRQGGVAHLPAADDLAIIIDCTIRPCLPGVVSTKTMTAQVIAVAKIGRQNRVGVEPGKKLVWQKPVVAKALLLS